MVYYINESNDILLEKATKEEKEKAKKEKLLEKLRKRKDKIESKNSKKAAKTDAKVESDGTTKFKYKKIPVVFENYYKLSDVDRAEGYKMMVGSLSVASNAWVSVNIGGTVINEVLEKVYNAIRNDVNNDYISDFRSFKKLCTIDEVIFNYDPNGKLIITFGYNTLEENKDENFCDNKALEITITQTSGYPLDKLGHNNIIRYSFKYDFI